MPTRVSPSELICASIDELLDDADLDRGEGLGEVAALTVRLVFQSTWEREVTEFVGRERYARG